MPAERSRRPWSPAFITFPWETEERAYAALLDALTHKRLELEGIEREMDAHARRSLADVQEAQEEIAEAELAEARDELGLFRDALQDARKRGGSGEATYDAADPRQDALADALIQYLVRTEYAEVRTEERAPGRYIYHVRVDWDRLRGLAEELGQTLPE